MSLLTNVSSILIPPDHYLIMLAFVGDSVPRDFEHGKFVAISYTEVMNVFAVIEAMGYRTSVSYSASNRHYVSTIYNANVDFQSIKKDSKIVAMQNVAIEFIKWFSGQVVEKITYAEPAI